MIGNSLVPILTSNNDQGFIVTASLLAAESSAYNIFANKGWYAGYSKGTQAITIIFPKKIKLTRINMSPFNSFSGCSAQYSINQNSYLAFLINTDNPPVIAKSIKLYGHTGNGYDSGISPVTIYGFYSPGKFLMKTSNNYIYNSNIVDKNSNNIESINSNNALPEFIEECTTDIKNIDETFSVIKLVK